MFGNHSSLNLTECLVLAPVDRDYYINKFAIAAGGSWTTDATWSTTSNGAADTVAPTAADDVFLDAFSGAVTINGVGAGRSLNCTGYTNTLTHNAGSTLQLGDATAGLSNIAFKLVSGMTYTLGSTSTSALSLVSTSTTQQTIDFGGKSHGNLTINGAGSSYLLSSAATGTAATVVVSSGTFNTNNQTCSWSIFSSSNTNVRAITLGTSTISLNSTLATTIWNFGTATNLTFSGASSTIIIATATANARTISPGSGFAYGTLTYTVAASTGRIDFFTSHSWSVINVSDASGTKALRFQASTTVTVGTWNVNGRASNLITIDSSSAGSAFTLSKTSGTVISDYLSLKDSTATGGASFYAGANSTNVSGNTGWIFNAPPSGGGGRASSRLQTMQNLQNIKSF